MTWWCQPTQLRTSYSSSPAWPLPVWKAVSIVHRVAPTRASVRSGVVAGALERECLRSLPSRFRRQTTQQARPGAPSRLSHPRRAANWEVRGPCAPSATVSRVHAAGGSAAASACTVWLAGATSTNRAGVAGARRSGTRLGGWRVGEDGGGAGHLHDVPVALRVERIAEGGALAVVFVGGDPAPRQTPARPGPAQQRQRQRHLALVADGKDGRRPAGRARPGRVVGPLLGQEQAPVEEAVATPRGRAEEPPRLGSGPPSPRCPSTAAPPPPSASRAWRTPCRRW